MGSRQINLRLDEGLLAMVDEARGLVPRNAWVLEAVKYALGQDVVLRSVKVGPVVSVPPVASGRVALSASVKRDVRPIERGR